MTLSDIDQLLRDYCRQMREQKATRNPSISYYLLSKYLEGKTTPGENILVAGMMAGDETLYELIRVSRMEMLYLGLRYYGVHV